MDLSAIVNNNNTTTVDYTIEQLRQMIDTNLEESKALSNAFCGSAYMTVDYDGFRKGSNALVWTVKLAYGAQHYEYRLLDQGVDAPIFVLRDVKCRERSRAVEFSGFDHAEVIRRMDEAVCFVTGMK
jgi:hypothetical protein